MPRAASGGTAPRAVKTADFFTAASYSRWRDWKQCAARAKYKYLLKLPEPGSPAMDRGSEIGKLAEEYLLGNIATLPKELSRFPKEFQELRELGAIPEQQWAVRRDWTETEWFAEDVYIRFKVDAYAIPRRRVLRIIDFKTGKLKDMAENQLQLDLYGVGALSLFDIDVAFAELWYLDQGVLVGGEGDEIGTYRMEDLSKLQKTWDDRLAPMFSDRTFVPTPNYLCRYCTFSRSKGGECKF